ncbi:hypothetical protein EDC04DRAFT_181199 [Pisolithus marmoratus]|nr:hypothetical protein EDC04DRAFT_181199 [Pisolithus marmoratus]
MSLAEYGATAVDPSPQPSGAAMDAVSDGLSNVSLQSMDTFDLKDIPSSVLPPPQDDVMPQPFIMYSRSQLLFLHKSPLVKIPDGMPALKEWFGTDNDQGTSKKDSDISAGSSNARDRRFRRDAEDGDHHFGEPPSHSHLRWAISNTNLSVPQNRERERDVDREQDRDSKAKEGHERLRNLSDKYDRDRRGISSISQLRSKDREVAPHISNSGARVAAQGQQALSAHAADSREPSKKKDGESTNDWRRGTEPSRSVRERPESGRREREERDRDRESPRSRAQDSSRARRDGDREGDRRTDREDRLGDVGYRKDKDDRDKEYDRESEVDDPRRWRDDGKREERMAARREREFREREREGGSRDRARERSTWDAGDRSDRRWVADDRDNRGKRANGRERRVGDDAKDRDERKDREREKEPAWMDTYIPCSSGSGFTIQRPDGELDGIQAFKKELREKEQKSQISLGSGEPLPDSLPKTELLVSKPESQLDEIQLFKLMMRKEEEKRKADIPLTSSPRSNETVVENSSLPSKDSSFEAQESKSDSAACLSTSSTKGTPSLSVPPAEEIISTASKSLLVHDSVSPSLSVVTNCDKQEPPQNLTPVNSRLLQTHANSELTSLHDNVKPATDVSMVASQGDPFNNAVGSRLLALASRPSQNPIGAPRSGASQSPVSFSLKNNLVRMNMPAGASGNLAQALGDIPAQSLPQAGALSSLNGFYPFDDRRDGTAQTPLSDATFHHSLAFTCERNSLAQVATEQVSVAEAGAGLSGPPLDCVNSGAASAKGSRFAKFFDGKRENQPAPSKGFTGNSGFASQKADMGVLHPPSNADAKAMEDIFAMLNNSAHAQRLNTAPEMPNLDHLGSQPTSLHSLQPPQSQPPTHSRLDSLYDGILDDRNFVPDGMVPGLRSLPPRIRQNAAMFSDVQDDPSQFNVQRGSAQMYQGAIPSIHLPHTNVGRGGTLPVQGAQHRGGPSPNPLAPAQRLPPGLANLGGRPPHDPNPFVSSSIGITNGSILGGPRGNVPTQQPFSTYQQAASLGFSGGPQARVPHSAHQLQGALVHNPLQGLVHPANLGTGHAQLLGLGGTGGFPGGLRGPNGGFGQGPQGQPPHMSLRQHQQPQQIPPHMLPLHFQQQGLGAANNQPTHDLMSLLMNGTRRIE